MRMKSAVVFVALVGLVTLFHVPATAQGVNFSGTWTLDGDASELPQMPGGRGGRGGGGGRGPGGPGGAASVTITQSDGTLTMSQAGRGGQSRTVTYQLDGSESSNAGPRGDLTTTSSWDGTTLVTTGSQEMSTQFGEFTIALVEHRSLSDDGQTMTVKTTRTTPRGDIAATLVYRKPTG